MRLLRSIAAALAAALVPVVGVIAAPATQAAPSNLSVQMAYPWAGTTSGAVVSYLSTSSWAKTNVSVTFPGWTALGTFANTGASGCPAPIVVTASRRGAPANQPASVSECSWSQDSTGALLSLVVESATGLDGLVQITLPPGSLRNPPAPSVYSVRVAEQSNGGWGTLSAPVPISTPSGFAATLTNAIPAAPAGVTLAYTSASGWADTNISFTMPGWTANSTFASTGTAPCPSAIQVTALPSTATFSQCTWSQDSTGAVFSVVVSSPVVGLNGPVTVVLPRGAVTNPALAGTYQVRVTEQSSAGFVSLSDEVAVGVPSNLTVSLGSRMSGQPAGATTVGVTTWSTWASTNLVFTFPGFVARKGFSNTGSGPCPERVRIVATPSLVTTSNCSWTQESAGAVLAVTLDAPGYGLQGPVTVELSPGMLVNPTRTGLVNIRLAQQSAAGWTGASAPVIIR